MAKVKESRLVPGIVGWIFHRRSDLQHKGSVSAIAKTQQEEALLSLLLTEQREYLRKLYPEKQPH